MIKLTPRQLRELRSEIEEDFARLLRSMVNGRADDSFPANEPWHPESPSDSSELDAVLHERAQTRLPAVTAALRRIETGAYGVCARCGNRISFDRLVAFPETTLCSVCGTT
jgi:RNA polymerase-binding transcription factor DksA